MIKKIFFFAFFAVSLASAQNDEAFVDSMVIQKLAELELQQNPEYFFLKDYCDGNVQMFTMPDGSLCSSRSTYYAVYLFWKESDEVLKLQKFDNCGSYMPMSLNRSKDLKKILSKKETLIKESVKPYESVEQDSNAYGNMSVKSCHKAYKFVFDGKIFEKKFKEFDLANEANNNRNADYNNSLLLIKLDEKISEMIKSFDEKGRFFREK